MSEEIGNIKNAQLAGWSNTPAFLIRIAKDYIQIIRIV
jgi:hypothetical protein